MINRFSVNSQLVVAVIRLREEWNPNQLRVEVGPGGLVGGGHGGLGGDNAWLPHWNAHTEAAVIISGDRNSFDISALLSLDPNRYARNSRPIDSRSYRNQFGALFQRGENCPHNYPQTVLDTELPVIVVWLLNKPGPACLKAENA